MVTEEISVVSYQQGDVIGQKCHDQNGNAAFSDIKDVIAYYLNIL